MPESPYADTQKLLNDVTNAAQSIKTAEEMMDTPAIIHEAVYLAAAMPSVIRYVRSMEAENALLKKDHESMRVTASKLSHAAIMALPPKDSGNTDQIDALREAIQASQAVLSSLSYHHD